MFRSTSRLTRNMSMQVVHTDKAPGAVGPYVQAMKLGDVLYTSGSIGLNPQTGDLVQGGVEAEAEQALTNLKEVVEAAGSSLSKVVKTTVFLKNMGDFAAINKIYEKRFEGHKPARSCVEVAGLPKGCLFEIEAIASLK